MSTMIPKYRQGDAGSLNRSTDKKFAEYVTPQDFGAVGDGVANDTTAWTNWLAATGSKYVPTGSYLISGTVYKYTNGTFFNTYPNSYTAGYGAGAKMASSNLDPDRGNVLIGQSAGSEITSGYKNVAIGAYAIKSGNSFHNVAIGSQALRDCTSGFYNVIVGSDSGYKITTGADNCVLGAEALTENTTGNANVAIGISSMFINTTGSGNTAVGRETLQQNTTGNYNTAVGQWAGETNRGSNNTFVGFGAGRRAGFSAATIPEFITCVGYNAGTNAWDAAKYVTAVGYQALGSDTVASNFQYGVAVGYRALYVAEGSYNVAIGNSALVACTSGNTNTAIGDNALSGVTTEANSTGLGYNSAVTGSNQVQLGNSATTTYAYGAVQNRSDIRDKTDVKNCSLGLSFIEKLRPVDYRWDMRDDYVEDISTRPERPASIEPNASDEEKQKHAADMKLYEEKLTAWMAKNDISNITSDGSKKRNRFHHGLIAQEVKQVMDDFGIDFGGYQDHSIKGGKDVKSIGYEELIAPLIKAVQELSEKVKVLESKQ